MLSESVVFSAAEEDVVSDVVEQSELRSFEPGEVLYERNDPAEGFYAVLEGNVIIRRSVTEEHDTRTLAVKGNVFGLLSAVSNTPRRAMAFTGERNDAQCVHVPLREFIINLEETDTVRDLYDGIVNCLVDQIDDMIEISGKILGS